MKTWHNLTLEEKVARTAATGALWFLWCALLTVAVIYIGVYLAVSP